jgi:hypothetical protein
MIQPHDGKRLSVAEIKDRKPGSLRSTQLCEIVNNSQDQPRQPMDKANHQDLVVPWQELREVASSLLRFETCLQLFQLASVIKESFSASGRLKEVTRTVYHTTKTAPDIASTS